MRLWRARRSSFRFLCLRIFLRRFLITLPKTHLAGKIESRPLDTAMRRRSQPATGNRQTAHGRKTIRELAPKPLEPDTSEGSRLDAEP